MFFFAVMGTSQKRENITNVSFHCPSCNSNQTMSVFKNYSYFHIFFVPIFKFSIEYDGICTSCGHEFFIDDEVGKLIDKNLISSIDNTSFHEKQFFTSSPSVCPVCHNHIDHDDVYCRKCGYKL